VSGIPPVRDFRHIVLENYHKLRYEIINPLYDATFKNREEEVIDSIEKYFKNKTLQLNVPIDMIFKYSAATCTLRAIKTHKRIVTFKYNRSRYKCETSDISFVVDYKYQQSSSSEPQLVSRTISFAQLKMGEKYGRWRLAKNQLYFMRYWPPFTYGGKLFDIKEFRDHPDLGSFYVFIYRNILSFLHGRFAVPVSDLEAVLRRVFSPSDSNRDYERIPDALLYGVTKIYLETFMWKTLLQDLGLFSKDAEAFVGELYPGLLDPDPPPEKDEEIAEGFSVGVRIIITVVGGG
jgi:hypothetical protein